MHLKDKENLTRISLLTDTGFGKYLFVAMY